MIRRNSATIPGTGMPLSATLGQKRRIDDHLHAVAVDRLCRLFWDHAERCLGFGQCPFDHQHGPQRRAVGEQRGEIAVAKEFAVEDRSRAGRRALEDPLTGGALGMSGFRKEFGRA